MDWLLIFRVERTGYTMPGVWKWVDEVEPNLYLIYVSLRDQLQQLSLQLLTGHILKML